MECVRVTRGFVGIGVYRPKTEINCGVLIRSARCFGASFVYTIGRRWTRDKSSTAHERHIPLLHFADAEAWSEAMPDNARLVAVEIAPQAKPLEDFKHPERAVYLLGAEDVGLHPDFLERADDVISIPTDYCLNVSVAGSLVLYDRAAKAGVHPKQTDRDRLAVSQSAGAQTEGSE
jgi:tRNA G18 (ribose-2'-O)-methylase SpoU